MARTAQIRPHFGLFRPVRGFHGLLAFKDKPTSDYVVGQVYAKRQKYKQPLPPGDALQPVHDFAPLLNRDCHHVRYGACGFRLVA